VSEGLDRALRQADRRVAAIALSLVAFGLLFVVVRAERTHAVDLAVTLRLQGRRSASLRRVMAATSWPGFPPQSRIIPPLVVGGWLAFAGPRPARYQAAAWGGALVSTVVKSIVRRPRPLPPQVEVALAPLGGTSFPSGHVLTFTTFYGFLAYLLSSGGRGTPARRIAAGGLATLIALVGPSRVERGHHWPTDVVASSLLGLAYLLALVGLYERGLEAGGRTGSGALPRR
jgi:undecaprenyl-diphosphatase